MKATLEFDLNNPDDRMNHLRSVKSLDMACVLFEITHNLKRKLENRFEAQPQERDEFDGLDEVFKEVNNLMSEHGIIMEDLIN